MQRKNGLVAVDEELLEMIDSKIIATTENLEDKICSICMKDYDVNDKVLTTPCSHNYHQNCVLDWFRKSNKCPICKFKIVKENVVLKPVKNK
jgi:E3 ubiquitin-protein ligase DOA10